MRVLLITKKLPFPARDGETIALTNMLDHYKAIGATLTVMSMQTPKHPYGTENIPESYSHVSFHVVNVAMESPRWRYFSNLFSRQPIHVERFYQPSFAKALEALLSSSYFDIIQLEGLVLLSYLPIIRKASKARVIYRSHNVEGLIWQRLSGSSKGLFFRWYYNLQGRRLWRWERENFDTADAVLAISRDDADTYSKWNPRFSVSYLPVSMPAIPESNSGPIPTSAAFIGALDWLPNRNGLERYLQDAWPGVVEAMPEATLHIAGRHAPDNWPAVLPPGVIWHGEVENAHAFMQQYAVVVVPLWAGSGLKIKVVEAIAAGIPVVTTPVGAEGLPEGAAALLQVGNTSKELAAVTIACLQEPDKARAQAEQLRAFVRKDLSASAVQATLLQCITQWSDR